MKKLLSICLSIILVLGLMPSTIATATNTKTVATTGTTLIEAEDYPTTYVNDNGAITAYDANVKTDVTTASGGKYLYNNKGYKDEGSAEHYWEINLVIQESGTYKFAFSVPALSRYRFYSVKVMVGENELYSETTTWPSYSSDTPSFSEQTKEQYLEAGTYTFRFYVGKGTGGNQQLNFDYVSITPVSTGDGGDTPGDDTPTTPEENSAVTLEATGTTKIEAENKTTVTKYLKTTPMSGGEPSGDPTEVTELFTAPTETQEGDVTVLKYNFTKTSTDTENYYQELVWKVPIEVSTEGSYEIEYCANQSGNYHGNLYAVLDGTELTQLESVGSGTPTLVTYKTTQTLTVGTHYVSVIAKRAWNLNCTLVVDYVSITPAAEAPKPEAPKVTVSSTEETIIEAEDYPTTYVNDNGTITSYDATIMNNVATASGGEYVFNNKGASIVDAEHYWEINLEITTAGVYEITSVIPALSRYRFHSLKIVVGGNEFYSESSGQPSHNSDIPEFREETAQQYLEAGVHSYRFYAGKGTGGNQQLYFDAIKLELIKEDHTPPIASNVSFTETTPGWVGGKVTVTYSYSSSSEEKGSKLQILEKDGEEWKVLSEEVVSEGSGSIDITNAMANKEIKAVFFAVDEYGAKTEVFEKALEIPRREFYIECNFDEAESYKADVQVDFFEDGTKDLLIILALYDKTGAMVDYKTEQLNMTSKNVYSKQIEKNHADAVSATLFVWSGTSIESANDIAYIDKLSR